jgi:glycerol dehydrogenase-like iron-containing ADH family enzyme
VGVATIIEAAWFERLRALSKDEAAELLGEAVVPAREIQEAQIRKTVPLIADELIESHPIYVQLADPAVLDACKQRILDQWDEIQAVAANVPTAQQVHDWLKMLGAPTTAAELDITAEQVEIAKEYGLYLRERFSMNIIRKLFGW